MRHPHVLCCLDIFITEAATFIVTEYCDSDLSKLLKANIRLPAGQALGYFQQTVKGYNFMRELGYIHRDLKPANLLLKSNSLKIADFGFSKLLRKEPSIKESYNVGSPLYMSP